jgi:hypothetical protein
MRMVVMVKKFKEYTLSIKGIGTVKVVQLRESVRCSGICGTTVCTYLTDSSGVKVAFCQAKACRSRVETVFKELLIEAAGMRLAPGISKERRRELQWSAAGQQ